MTARRALLFILAITIWRVVLLRFDQTDLFVDEAQYWLWSQHLDFGYYSKPPMIAWVIRAVTGVAGSNDIFWIRVAGPLVHMATALVLMAAARRFIGPEVAGWTGVTYVTAPAVALSSILFSTDVILLFFIAIALWAYFTLTQTASVGRALAMGIAFGCAFLSKYAVLFLLPGGVVALALIPAARISWRDFIVAGAAAALVAFPNLWWNFTHDATTVRHTQDIAHWSSLGLNAGGGLEFFLAQFGVVGPIVFFAILWATYRMIRGRGDQQQNLLVWLSMPVVALITVQALIAKAYANWGVTAYAAGTMLAVLVLYRLWPKGLRISLAINGLVALLLPLAPVLADQLVLPNGVALLQRYVGRSDVSRAAADLAGKAGIGIIVSDNRDILADLYHTLRDQPYRIYAQPPAGLPMSYYEQELPLPADTVEDVLFVTRNPLTCPARPPELLASWTPEQGYYRSKTLYAYKTAPACIAPRP